MHINEVVKITNNWTIVSIFLKFWHVIQPKKVQIQWWISLNSNFISRWFRTALLWSGTTQEHQLFCLFPSSCETEFSLWYVWNNCYCLLYLSWQGIGLYQGSCTMLLSSKHSKGHSTAYSLWKTQGVYTCV